MVHPPADSDLLRRLKRAFEAFRAGRKDEALELGRRVLRAAPGHPDALGLVGALEQQRGRLAEAEDLFHQAAAIQPQLARSWNNLANCQAEQGKREAAVENYRKALALQPAYPMALKNLGQTLRELGRLSEAIDVYRRALDIDPNYPEAHLNLGIALSGTGDLTAAYACFERALALKPDFDAAHANLIYTLDLMPGSGFAEQQAERRRWWQRHAARYAPAAPRHANDRDPDRRLRIGYVSADFRRHSAAYCFGPVLRHHDRERFEVACYSGVTAEDELTQQFKERADLWCSTLGLSDDALAERIRADSIDILVDLSGHTLGNRLLVFARKPAPIQVTAWGHATGTGCKTIDYLFADSVAIPAAARPLFAETIYDLPCLITCELAPYAPPVSPLPAATRGTVTFGCFNRLAKITPDALALWARILGGVPGSRLLLKDYSFDDAASQAYIRPRLASHGIAAERVELRGGTSHAEQLAAYGEVDIALDPFPQNGGIGTYEALGMGVPIVAMLGNSVPGRVAAAILSAVGLADWIAADEDAYVRLAVERARDPDALTRLRSDLRRRVATSPAGDLVRYTHAVEDAYRVMWRKWCERV